MYDPVANVVKSGYNETEDLLEVRFIATLVPAGSIWFFVVVVLGFFFVSLYYLSVSGHWDLKIYVNSSVRGWGGRL